MTSKDGKKSLKDQLQSWKKDHAPAPDKPAAGAPASGRAGKTAPAGRAAAKPTPRPAATPAPPPPKKATDAELFAAALDKVGKDAVLAKYDKAPVGDDGGRGPGGGAPFGGGRGDVVAPLYREGEDDAAMFARFVGDTRPVDAAEKKRLADEERRRAQARLEKRVARDQVKPQAVLDLHGEDRLTAAARVRSFVGAARAHGQEHVLIVHGKGTGTLADVVSAVLDDDGGVAEHCAASPKLGGAGARVARLRIG